MTKENSQDIIDFATTRDASKFVDAVNSILNRKTYETITSMKQDMAMKIMNQQPEE